MWDVHTLYCKDIQQCVYMSSVLDKVVNETCICTVGLQKLQIMFSSMLLFTMITADSPR